MAATHADGTGAPPTTLVVNLVGDPVHGMLAESRFTGRRFLPGGEHNMYELAFAAAAAGWPVELRGWLDRASYERFRSALGVAPRVELAPRLPTADDLVVIPEGWKDPLDYARMLLSPARLIVFILAAPGLFGWDFRSGGHPQPDPLTVPLDAVATPAQFRALHELGIALITHSPGLEEAAHAAGVPCGLVGTGRPYKTFEPTGDEQRSADVAGLLANRWAPLVRKVADELSDVGVDLIEEAPNEEVLARLSRARVLLWPSRIEGHATIPWEARSVGCVPVALSTNRFAVGLDEESGAVVVDTVDQLAPATRRLLNDDQRWAELSARGRERARAEVDWNRYVQRTTAVLGLIRERPGREAMAGIGAAFRTQEGGQSRAWQERLEALTAELNLVVADRDRLAELAAELAAELERVLADRDGLAGTAAELESELRRLHDRKAVRAMRRIDAVRRRGLS